MHEEFEAWLDDQERQVQTRIVEHYKLLGQFGPTLGRPRVDTVKGSKFANMKELRIQIRGDPWRVLFAFDPERAAIILVGGNKGPVGNRWYRDNVPTADARFQTHLDSL